MTISEAVIRPIVRLSTTLSVRQSAWSLVTQSAALLVRQLPSL